MASADFMQKLSYCNAETIAETAPMGAKSPPFLPANERQIRPLLTYLNHDGERLHVWQEVAKAGEKITIGGNTGIPTT